MEAKDKIRCKILAAGASDVHRFKELRLKNALAKDDIVVDTLTINLKDVGVVFLARDRFQLPPRRNHRRATL